ncbi:MAG: histidine phosphatase family protein [Prevotellaceae bacterium]|nr:histidine phosphatase family protein [Prevotellaceae bacterium]
MSTTIYLMRHGETEENLAHILQGHLPGRLTRKGVEQAEIAGEKLKDMHIDVIVSSDLQRCADTAEIVNCRICRDIVFTKLLRERDWGSLTGTVVEKGKKIVLPKDVESVKAMKARARIFIDYVMKTYPGKTVLVISHGFFCRCLRAVAGGGELEEIRAMGNADILRLELE